MMIGTAKLFEGIKEAKVLRDVDVTGISSHTDAVLPGDLFIAATDTYITQAKARGALAIVGKEGPDVIHPNPRTLEPLLAARLYRDPSHALEMIGITGTNGKSTTSFMIHHLFETLGKKTGLIGTIQYQVGKKIYPATHTTPNVCQNQRLLFQMREEGMEACVMEVTSHALKQERVTGVAFDTAIYTQLTQDHLDYHKTMEAYAQAKNLLFQKELKQAIVNSDCPWHEKVIKGTKAKILTYGTKGDLSFSNLLLSEEGAQFTLQYEGEEVLAKSPYIGRFNVDNFLAATLTGIVHGFKLQEVVEVLSEAPSVPGRLEKIPNQRGFTLFVDFAHTEDALANVLMTLSSVKKGRLIALFGCGGDRDEGKRPKMAKVCEKFSDYCIITSDNPRTEDPKEIIQEIQAGLTSAARYEMIVDRKEAIKRAIHLAKPGDIVLLAGRGHERYQIVGSEKIPFDDREEALKSL